MNLYLQDGGELAIIGSAVTKCNRYSRLYQARSVRCDKTGFCIMEEKIRNKQNQLAREYITPALIQLVRENPLSAVSTKELAERAGVSGMTFYRNYTSAEDILLSRIRDILTQDRQNDADRMRQGHFYDAERVHHGLTYFYRQREFAAGLICCDLSDVFLRELTEFALDKWLPQQDDTVEPSRLVSFVGILFNSYMTWIQSHQEMSLEDLTRQIAVICRKAYA